MNGHDEIVEQPIPYLNQAKQNYQDFVKSKDDAYLRMSGYNIVGFYRHILYNSSKLLDIPTKESYSIEKKIDSLSFRIPAIEDNEILTKTLPKVRNILAHRDVIPPKKSYIKNLIDYAPKIQSFLEKEIRNYKKKKQTQEHLKYSYFDIIKYSFFILGILRRLGYERITDILEYKIKKYSQIKLEELSNDNIKILIDLINIEKKRMDELHDQAYRVCPKCGGNMVVTYPQRTNYSGNPEDPQAISYDVWMVIKCEKCGHIIEKEHITTEYI